MIKVIYYYVGCVICVEVECFLLLLFDYKQVDIEVVYFVE